MCIGLKEFKLAEVLLNELEKIGLKLHSKNKENKKIIKNLYGIYKLKGELYYKLKDLLKAEDNFKEVEKWKKLLGDYREDDEEL